MREFVLRMMTAKAVPQPQSRRIAVSYNPCDVGSHLSFARRALFDFGLTYASSSRSLKHSKRTKLYHCLSQASMIRSLSVEKLELLHHRDQRIRCAPLPEIGVIDVTDDERKAIAPQPLPTKRPRSLTIPLSEGGGQAINEASTIPADGMVDQQTNIQHQSRLMRLPVEIRRIIWEKAVGGNIFHIVRCPKRILGMRCSETMTAYPDIFKDPCWAVICRRGLVPRTLGVYAKGFSHSAAVPANILSILQSCRLV